MTTRRQDILSTLQTTVAAVGTVNTAATNRILPVDDSVTLPFVNIRSGLANVDTTDSDLGHEEYTWSIPMDVITKTTDIETLLGDIHVAVMADDTIGGNVDILTLISVEMREDFDQPSGAQAMTITYEVQYELTRGTV